MFLQFLQEEISKILKKNLLPLILSHVPLFER